MTNDTEAVAFDGILMENTSPKQKTKKNVASHRNSNPETLILLM